MSILGQEFAPEAEDVTQDVMLRVHHSLRSFRGEAKFGSWIYRVAFNHALNVKARIRYQAPHVSDQALATTPSQDRGRGGCCTPCLSSEVSMHDDVIDQLLRDAMAGETPRLSPSFDDQVMRRVRPRHLTRTGRVVIAVYLVGAAAIAVWLMRDLPAATIVATLAIGMPVAAAASAYGRRLAAGHEPD